MPGGIAAPQVRSDVFRDPNGARKQEGFISEPSGDSPFYELIWRQYDKLNQRYLELGEIRDWVGCRGQNTKHCNLL